MILTLHHPEAPDRWRLAVRVRPHGVRARLSRYQTTALATAGILELPAGPADCNRLRQQQVLITLPGGDQVAGIIRRIRGGAILSIQFPEAAK